MQVIKSILLTILALIIWIALKPVRYISQLGKNNAKHSGGEYPDGFSNPTQKPSCLTAVLIWVVLLIMLIATMLGMYYGVIKPLMREYSSSGMYESDMGWEEHGIDSGTDSWQDYEGWVGNEYTVTPSSMPERSGDSYG